jgi:hypothetical protein
MIHNHEVSGSIPDPATRNSSHQLIYGGLIVLIRLWNSPAKPVDLIESSKIKMWQNFITNAFMQLSPDHLIRLSGVTFKKKTVISDRLFV